MIQTKHPFAVKAHFKFSLVLTFAYPIEVLKPLIPDHLDLSTYKDKYAFLAVAFVSTKHLRPKGVPKRLGKDFFLAGYRVFVEYKNQSGVKRRGLYILKSQTDKKLMMNSGNLLTYYNYEYLPLKLKLDDNDYYISADKISVHASKLNPEALLTNSIFDNFKEARRFAGPMPYTFSFDSKKQQMIVVKGIRNQWDPQPVNILNYQIPYLDNLKEEPILANAFITENIDYEWTKGEIENY